MKRNSLLALAVTLVAGILITIYLVSHAALPPISFLPPTPLTMKTGRIPDRWIPAKWVWLQKVCLRVFGNPKQIMLDVQIMEVSETVKSLVAESGLGQPQLESNGIAIWIVLNNKPIKPKGYSTVMNPRMIIADRMQGSMMTGDTAESCRFDSYARLEKDSVELSTRVMLTAGNLTNFVAAVRAQVPWSNALFILDVREPETATNRRAFWVSSDEIDAKGNRVHSIRP